MNVLLKKARIIAPLSSFHNQQKDVFIRNGVIDRISDYIDTESEEVIDHPHLHISTGWVDVFADFGEPGYEYRELIDTGIRAAAAGGFTDVFLIPNTKPTISNRSQVAYLRHRSENSPVNLYPIGGVTKDLQGKELAEMYDMFEAGAIAFSDGLLPLQHTGLALKALQYVLPLNANIIQLPVDIDLSNRGLMNEGISSTRLGMPGKPALSEELAIHRSIQLTEYSGSRIHFTGISTRRSIQQIAEAKKHDLRVTASVTPYHCWFTDDILLKYDTNYKVEPPLRSAADRDAIRKAVVNGKIDCFASHHLPRNRDEKICEFEYAQYGMEGLETAFGVYNSLGAPLDLIIAMLSDRPRSIFGLPQQQIEEGAKACITLFDPVSEWVAEEKHLASGSKNNGFIGQTLKGKVLGIINNNQFISRQ